MSSINLERRLKVGVRYFPSQCASVAIKPGLVGIIFELKEFWQNVKPRGEVSLREAFVSQGKDDLSVFACASILAILRLRLLPINLSQILHMPSNMQRRSADVRWRLLQRELKTAVSRPVPAHTVMTAFSVVIWTDNTNGLFHINLSNADGVLHCACRLFACSCTCTYSFFLHDDVVIAAPRDTRISFECCTRSSLESQKAWLRKLDASKQQLDHDDDHLDDVSLSCIHLLDHPACCFLADGLKQ